MLTSVTICHHFSGFFTVLVRKGDLFSSKGDLLDAKGDLCDSKGDLFSAKGHLLVAKGDLFGENAPPVGREGRSDSK